MDVYDFMGDSPAAVLAEILDGVYVELTKNMEITEDGAHLKIDGGDDAELIWLASDDKFLTVQLVGNPHDVIDQY